MRVRHYALPLLLGAIASPCGADETSHVQASLIAASATVAPGAKLSLGLRLVHDEHWHTYWINPGDSGLPTRLEWTLPAGFAASALQWPAPRRFDVGGLFNFGYDGDIVLPVELSVPADAAPGNSTLHATAKWLVCREECIPGQADLSIDIQVSTSASVDNAADAARIAAARARIPKAMPWTGSARRMGDSVEIRLTGTGLPDASGLDAVPVERKLLDYAAPRIARDGDALVVTAGVSDYFDAAPAALTLVLLQGTGAWQVRIPYVPGSGDAPPARSP